MDPKRIRKRKKTSKEVSLMKKINSVLTTQRGKIAATTTSSDLFRQVQTWISLRYRPKWFKISLWNVTCTGWMKVRNCRSMVAGPLLHGKALSSLGLSLLLRDVRPRGCPLLKNWLWRFSGRQTKLVRPQKWMLRFQMSAQIHNSVNLVFKLAYKKGHHTNFFSSHYTFV